MATLIRDRDIERRIIARRRRRLGQDKFDEVWNGVYVMAPLANVEHQDCVSGLDYLLGSVVRMSGLGMVLPGTNVSDRRVGWTKNFRCPDVAVFLKGTTAVNCDTHWFGGPDFAVEVASSGERVKRKLNFYAKVGTRELLIVDRYPWNLSLYRLVDGELRLAGTSSVATGGWLVSNVLPLSFRLIDGIERLRIDVQ
ncbi:MAG TPA: Uma2 family endonuclease, partial [Planctomycetaceae bacterium]|nr:Uma2 family endonuclease [Planctomycetaceae bacterium]